MEVVLGRKTPPKAGAPACVLNPKHSGADPGLPSHPCTVQARHRLCVAMGTVDAEELLISQPLQPAHFKTVQVQLPCSLPPLDDSDDIVHLDVQLVWFFKVLKGPHVSGLGLRAKTCHCPP